MTNTEIITRSAIAAGLYTKEEAAAILKTGACLPLHTYKAWKSAGYQVKRGEKAILSVVLWKFRPGKRPAKSQKFPAC